MNLEFQYLPQIGEWLQIIMLGCVLSFPVTFAVEQLKSTGIKSSTFFFVLSIVLSVVFGVGFAYVYTDFTIGEMAWLAAATWLGSQGFYEKLQNSDGCLGKSFISLSERYQLTDSLGDEEA